MRLLIILVLVFFGLDGFRSVQAQQPESGLSLDGLDSLCVASRNSGNYKKAIEYGQQRADLAQKKGIDSIYAESLNNLAVLHFEAGEYDRVIPLAEKSLAMRKKILGEDHPLYALNINNLATFHWILGNFEQVEALYLQALSIQHKAQGAEHEDVALCMNNLSLLYKKLARYEEAIAYQKQAVQIFKKTKGAKHRDYAASLNVLASLYKNTGNQELAIPLLEEVLLIRAEDPGKTHPDYAASLKELAGAFRAKGQLEKAEEIYRQAWDIYMATLGEDHPSMLELMSSLSKLHLLKNEPDLAEKLALKVVVGARRKYGLKNTNYANFVEDLAEFYYKIKQFDKAVETQQQATEIYEQAFGLQHPQSLQALNFLAKIQIARNNQALAQSILEKAIQANLVGAESKQTIEWANLSRQNFYSNAAIFQSLQLYVKSLEEEVELIDEGRNAKMFLLLQTAADINERIRLGFSADRDKLRALGQLTDILGRALSLDYEQEDNIRKQALFQLAERNKSILLADATKAQRARNLGDLPDSLALKEIKLQNRYDELRKELSLAQNEDSKAKVLAAQSELNIQIEDFRQALRNKFPKYHALKYENITATAQDIQKNLTKGTLFLEYFLYKNQVNLFVLSSDKLSILKLDLPEKEIQAQIKRLRQSLSSYELIRLGQSDEPYRESAYFFYEKLLAPALSLHPEAKRLIIVTDGELGHLPFESFLTAPVPAGTAYPAYPYLCKDFQISYNYSGTLWKENLSRKPSGNGRMLAVAANYNPLAEKSATRSARFTQLDNLRNSLNPLPEARKEVIALSRRFKGDFWLDNQASERQFKGQAANYGIIHLAMHGLLNKQNPILSSLAFTDLGGEEDDHFLEAWEIAQLKLDADLVVLSACETGYGKFEQGEGVMSLARSFMYAGTPALVVSLWQVNDGSTSYIMDFFYSNLAQGMDKAEALRQAKLKFMAEVNNPAMAHPAYWAAFTLLGDTTPIQLEVQGSNWGLYALLGLVLLALGAFWWLKKRSVS